MYGWANCIGGWHTLPSGNIICYVGQALPLQNRTDFCNLLGGYVLELQTMEDYQALVYYMWKLISNFGKSNSTLVAVGAATESLQNDTGNTLLWQYSRNIVDYSLYGIIRPIQNGTQNFQQDQILYLQPVNYENNFNPNFKLLGLLSNDSFSEFICMKPGKS